MKNQNLKLQSNTWLDTLAMKEEKKDDLMNMMSDIAIVEEENFEEKRSNATAFVENLLTLQISRMGSV